MTPLPLPEGRLDLWFAWPEQADAAAERADCLAILTEEERARAARFAFARDRHAQVATRALVRVVLGRYLGLAPQALRFGQGAHGKPELAPAQRGATRLAFNVSHTDGLVLLGATCGLPLGVDVESLGRDPLDGFARAFLTTAELDAAGRLDAPARHRRQLETWTLKEAYIKARGLGLAVPLHDMAFGFADPAAPRFRTTGTLAGEAGRWAFHRFAVGRTHLGAACVAARDGGVPPVHARSVTPLLRRVEPLALD